jgi:tRNA (guanine6-N2)-methyltransferase
METYLSTFVAGLGGPVRSALEERLPDARIEIELDGLILYESGREAAAIRGLPFFNNSFLVLKTLSGLGAGRGEEVLNEMLAAMLRDGDLAGRIPRHLKGTFRLVTSWSNVLTAVDRELLEKVEERIAAAGRLRPHRGRPDHELWLSYRSEGHGFLLLRLTRHAAYEKLLEKGTLRPEIAWMLCWLSEPREGELMLDPFCGSGAIPMMRASRATQFPRGLVLASDLDAALVEKLKARVKDDDLKRRVVVRQGDARHLSRYEDGSIHKIVTDPPWGSFQELAAGPESFYREVLTELARVLAPGGLAVILLARTDFLLPLLATLPALNLVESWPILVSGKKAEIFKLRKPPEGD